MSELDLFPEREERPDDAREVGGPHGARAPLPARMRPRTLEEFEGQDHLLGPDGALRPMLEGIALSSFILWGPPGSGKTTLARLLADRTDATFVALSAVTDGLPRVREIIAEARERRRATGRDTILFCDEIHRFNRTQQDALLPHVEEGVVVLVGATTENPSFEIVRPLLSRAPVFVLEPLEPSHLVRILQRALNEPRGLGGRGIAVDEGVLEVIARSADGDARRALGILDSAAELASDARITAEIAERAVQHRYGVYDKSGEEHYNLVSALHKAVRGSDPDGALYWLARMLEAGEDPLYIARRVVRIASEDVGLADPAALRVALAARDAFDFLGSPEGELALAEAVVYLATAPKSNRVYVAWKAARDAARETPGAAVPLHLRNAPTGMMRDLGYGKEYRYDHDERHGVAAQRYLPESLAGRRFYRPGRFGFEVEIRERLEWWEEKREELRSGDPGDEDSEADG